MALLQYVTEVSRERRMMLMGGLEVVMENDVKRIHSLFPQSMAYLLSGNMDQGSSEFQLEAAISKVYSSVSYSLLLSMIVMKPT